MTSTRGRGRGRLVPPPVPKPGGILSVSKKQGLQFVPSPVESKGDGNNQNKNGRVTEDSKGEGDFTSDDVSNILNIKSGDEGKAVADHLISVMSDSKNTSGRVICQTCVSALFSSDTLNNLPTLWIVDILSHLENKIIQGQAFRDVLFARLEKNFKDRGSLRNVQNLYEYQANLRVLSGLSASLTTPNGDSYIPLLKATVTWITEMLEDAGSIETAAKEIPRIESAVCKYKNILQSPSESLVSKMYLNVRRAIISGKCGKDSLKTLLKCLEYFLLDGNLNKDVLAMYK